MLALAVEKQREPEPDPSQRPLQDLTDDQNRQLGERMGIVEAWKQLSADFETAGKSRGEALKVFLAMHSVSKTSLYKWTAALRQNDRLALLDRRSMACRKPVESLSESQQKRFLDLWLTTQRRTVALCHQIVAYEEQQAGRACPSVATFRRFARQIPESQKDYYRLGEREWKRQHEPNIHFDFEKYRAGEEWVGDFHEFDVFCRKSEHDPKIVRPLLSAFLDMRSRMCVGWYIGLVENQDAVLLAIRDGVVKYGPPKTMRIDNGKPYRAKGVSGGRPQRARKVRKIEDEAYVRSVLGGLEIIPHFTVPYNPNGKIIERWFGTVEMQFGAVFRSYCGPDQDDRFRQAWKFAHDHPEQCPTVAKLAEKFAKWVIGYHATPHTGECMNGLCPTLAFQEFNPIPRGVVPEGALDFLLMRSSKPVKVGKNGVIYNGIDYGAADMRLHLMHRQEVVLRIDPKDASFVIVCDLQGRPLLRATNNRLALHEVRQEHVAEGHRAKKRARRLAREISSGALKPATQDITTAAIDAKIGMAPEEAVAAATGTDDATARNLRPLRTDLSGVGRLVGKQSTPSPAEDPPVTLVDLAADEIIKAPEQEPVLSLADVLEAADGKIDPYADPDAEKEWGDGYGPI